MSVYQSLVQNIELLKQIITNQAGRLGYSSCKKYEQIFTNSDRLLRILKANLQYQYNHCVGELTLLENYRLIAENRTFRQQLDKFDGGRGESVDDSVYVDSARDGADLANFSRIQLLELIQRLNCELKARMKQIDDLVVIRNEIEGHLECQQYKYEKKIQESQQELGDFEHEAAVKLERIASLETEVLTLREELQAQRQRNQRLEEHCEEYTRLLKQGHAACQQKQELLDEMERRLHTGSLCQVYQRAGCEKEVQVVLSDSSTTSSTILKTQQPVAILSTPSVDKKAIPVYFNYILMPPEAIANNELQRSKKMRQSQLLQYYALDDESNKQKALESDPYEYLGRLQRNLDAFVHQDLQDSSLNMGKNYITNSDEYSIYQEERRLEAQNEGSFVLEISEVSEISARQAGESLSAAKKATESDGFTKNSSADGAGVGAGGEKYADEAVYNVLTAVKMMYNTGSQEMDDLAKIRRSVGQRCQRRTPSHRRLLAQHEH